MARIFYIYGVVPATAATSGAPGGMDDSPVGPIVEGQLAALASELPGDTYNASSVATLSGDLEWVASRATAHDLVLTWASDRGPVVPFPLFTSTFTSRDAVRAMLRDRADELRRVLDRVGQGREYALRVYRVDSELKAALPTLSADISSLAAAADAASPGQRYLLQRKLEERAKDELRATSERFVADITAKLAAVSLESVSSPIARVTADAPGTMILNAAFLVAPDGLHRFQEALTAIVTNLQPSGFRFDFTGPWPPYHFAEGGGR